jgi:uncharacterized protein (DUF58 family)
MTAKTTTGIYEERAEALGRALPALLLDAERIASTLALGVHGRRRSGMGETFWQFRRFRDGDAPQAIDWRKSARSHRLYVRENEWEAAGTVWLWFNRSRTMAFRSHLASETKAERALTLLLALAILLVRAGERIGALGLSNMARSDQYAVPRIANELTVGGLADDRARTLPPDVEISRFSSVVLFSDFLEPVDVINDRIARYASRDARGHLVQILDPAEETFPFAGRLQFRDVLGPGRLVVGRAESVVDAYREKLADHRAALQRMTQRLGWTFSVHHTDAAPTTALLSLFAVLSGEVERARRPGAMTGAAPEARTE